MFDYLYMLIYTVLILSTDLSETNSYFAGCIKIPKEITLHLIVSFLSFYCHEKYIIKIIRTNFNVRQYYNSLKSHTD